MMTKVGEICNACGKPWLPGMNGTVYHRCSPRTQFHCSNPEYVCDRCERPLKEHETKNYFCPPHDLTAEEQPDNGTDYRGVR